MKKKNRLSLLKTSSSSNKQQVEETSEEESISSSECESDNDGDNSRIAARVSGGQVNRTSLMNYLEPTVQVTQAISSVAQDNTSQDPGYLEETDEALDFDKSKTDQGCGDT